MKLKTANNYVRIIRNRTKWGAWL